MIMEIVKSWHLVQYYIINLKAYNNLYLMLKKLSNQKLLLTKSLKN